VAVREVPGLVPAAFSEAVEGLRDVRLRSEVVLTEVPAPQRIAPHSLALTADVVLDDAELATGRFVLLHDPGGQESWEGTFRVVTFVRAELEPEMGSDPMLGQVGWTWLAECLEGADAVAVARGGTVTRVLSESYGALADRPASVEVEVRASWSPVGNDLRPHLHGWADLLCTVAGLPPLPPGVAPLQRRAR
jgi:hypothetical protein